MIRNWAVDFAPYRKRSLLVPDESAPKAVPTKMENPIKYKK